jgi:hypothetical protein
MMMMRIMINTNLYKQMPEHIKKRFLYRKAVKDIWERKKNVGLIVTGATGSGKSEFALKLASDLDSSFSVERVVFNTQDFLRLLTQGDSLGKLKPGKAIVFDETSHDEAMDSRSSLSETNKQMASLSTIYRAMRLIVIYVAPNLSQIDSRVRAVSITGLFQMKKIDYVSQKSCADFYWSVQNSRSGEVYYKRPRLLTKDGKRVVCMNFWLARADKFLIKSYEKKKMAFIVAKLDKWYNSAKEKDIIDVKKTKTITELTAEVVKNKKLFIVNNRINVARIVEQFNIGRSKAQDIATLVNNM